MLVSAPPAVSCVSGSSNLDNFRDGVGGAGGRIVGALRGCCRQDLLNTARNILA